MGIREKLNDNPAIVTGITAGIILLALIFIVWQFRGTGAPRVPNQAYFTTDDGQTWFAADINNIPPFDHNGQQAVRVHVFRCGRGDPFVGYLERYTDRAKRQMEQAQADPERAMEMMGMYEEAMMMGMQVKKPGDQRWVNQMDWERAGRVMEVRCPDGSTEGLEMVFP